MQKAVTVLFISNRAALLSPRNSFKMIHVGTHSLHENYNPEVLLVAANLGGTTTATYVPRPCPTYC